MRARACLTERRAARRRAAPPPLPRTTGTSLVPPLVLSGHAASLTPYALALAQQAALALALARQQAAPLLALPLPQRTPLPLSLPLVQVAKGIPRSLYCAFVRRDACVRAARARGSGGSAPYSLRSTGRAQVLP